MSYDPDRAEGVFARADRLISEASSLKARAILAGAHGSDGSDDVEGFLAAMAFARQGDGAAIKAMDGFKATLGTSAATGQSVIPGNYVDRILKIQTQVNPYRQFFPFTTGVRGKGVDIPYEVSDSSLLRAQLQGGEAQSYGSNKDNRDFTIGSATATLYTLARIIDVGNQLLRQSAGAAEDLVVSKLARAFGLAEAYYIANGTGTSQPNGYSTAFAASAYAVANYVTALSSEPRVATIGRAIAALRGRFYTPNVVVMAAGDYAEAMTEGLGTAYAGGWAIDPAAGAAGSPLGTSIFGVKVAIDANTTSGTAWVIDGSQFPVFTGQDFTIDVSSEAYLRFDQNVTGFRGEEELAFTATPGVAIGAIQKVTGI